MAELNQRKKRSLRNLFVRPERQIRITFLILSGGIFSMALLTGYFMVYLAALVTEMRERDPISAVLLYDFIRPMFVKLVCGQVLLWGVSILLGVVITHRIYGPLIPILRHVRALAAGDFSSRVHLREKDEMGDLAAALNELATSLESKK
jgi:two-component system phosphate regulon sensor histidine kinase PhoR